MFVMKMHQLTTISLVLAIAVNCVMAEDEGGEDYYGEETCENESFYCDYDDASIFYRCIDGNFHTFHCPSGLHFSSSMQTCDWPHLADCSNKEEPTEDVGGHGNGESVHNEEDDKHNSVQSEDQVVDEGAESTGESSWISQAAASGKSWWRPTGLTSDQWQDVSTIKKPVFLPHKPDKPKSEPESEPQKSDDEESPPAPIQVSSTSSHSASIERPSSSSVHWNEGSCSSSNCQLPTCYCAGTEIPKGLPVSSVPQMVMITFDDEVSAAFYGYYQRLFRPGRYNPNGCPVRGGLYVSGSGTEYDLVYPLYAMGMEIASHTVSHRFPHTWWATATYDDYFEEASGQKENLITRAGIPSEAIKGFRVPFLQLGSDNMYSALYDSKFVYDTSMFTGNEWEGGTPVWPFTLDYVPSSAYCQHGPCPKKQYPGMWEIPVQRWYGLDGHSCAMPDGCSSTSDAEETLEYLKSNFRRFYNSNRAPFGVFIHARWFSTEHNLDALDRFIDYLLTVDDVYLVTPSQVIEWMKKPTPVHEINGFGPWSCQGAAKDIWQEK
ncbi:unnamed protein product [Candidula unifasciata]|uniref:Chitin-binding type-2 domain-containing protein n=1 Tax=Candidula unifasciata TaxID=100452 RepID=A0A8S3ZFL6_9EUPU|nr:unnamed protein product [Candidula unifasciata]